MRPPLYRNQLARDLDDWVADGLVAPENRAAILARVDGSGGGFGVPAVLGILGGLLIAAAILSFVAANWQGLDKLPRLVILFGSLWATLGLSGWAKARGREAIAETAFLIAIGVYGGAIWFVSQTYHLAGGAEDGMMLWALGALGAALLMRSHAAAAAGFLIALVWVAVAWYRRDMTALYVFPAAFALAIVPSIRQGWSVAIQAAISAAVVWLLFAVFRTAALLDWPLFIAAAFLAAIALAIWCALHIFDARHDWAIRAARYWTIAVAIGATFGTAHIYVGIPVAEWLPIAAGVTLCLAAAAAVAVHTRGLAGFDALVAVALALVMLLLPIVMPLDGNYRTNLRIPVLTLVGAELVWLISLGLRRGDRFAVNLGFIGFGLWIVYLYATVFDSFLNGALFFAVGGVILIAGAWALDRMRRTMLARAEAAA
ncbi:hypothetical protein sos41_18610 [Alphaproteobacteria bacterium SO-S41]|nr:hypothetical protein sos41_18610 [Alphaproteobacteria bacterium SO-S41]